MREWKKHVYRDAQESSFVEYNPFMAEPMARA